MTVRADGLHHVTAIAGDAQRNLDFYTRMLGLRFVKRTVNFDDPSAYHLYYGDGVGSPGSAMTFFTYPGARASRRGTGETSRVAFSVPEASLAFWRDRLSRTGVSFQEASGPFGEARLLFADPDGIGLALVADGEADPRQPWVTSDITAENAIRGFHGVTLRLSEAGPTARVLTEGLGYEALGQDGPHRRYAAPGASGARYIDILEDPGTSRATGGLGSVHHIAFAVADDAAELELRQRLVDLGQAPTPQIDRTYFHSIYFRSPGGVLFEVATMGPGFTVDESEKELGSSLKLPPQHEAARAEIERSLPPLVA